MELTLANFRAYVYIELNRGQKPSEIFCNSSNREWVVFLRKPQCSDGAKSLAMEAVNLWKTDQDQEDLHLSTSRRTSILLLNWSPKTQDNHCGNFRSPLVAVKTLWGASLKTILDFVNCALYGSLTVFPIPTKEIELNALVSCPLSSNNILWKSAFDCGLQRMRRGSCSTVFPQKKRTKPDFQNRVQDLVFIGRSSPIERLCCFLLSLVMASATLKRSIQENQWLLNVSSLSSKQQEKNDALWDRHRRASRSYGGKITMHGHMLQPHRNGSWKEGKWLWLNNLRIDLIWICAIDGCSKSWNEDWGSWISTIPRKFKTRLWSCSDKFLANILLVSWNFFTKTVSVIREKGDYFVWKGMFFIHFDFFLLLKSCSHDYKTYNNKFCVIRCTLHFWISNWAWISNILKDNRAIFFDINRWRLRYCLLKIWLS